MPALNVIDRDNLLRIIARLTERINRLEALLQGVPISNVRISDLSADKINTGTLIVEDGTDAAKIVVRDASHNDIVTLDTDGILVEDGKMVLKNDGDVISIDAKGIVSSANFTKSDVINGSLAQSITGTSAVDITGATLTVTVARTTTILVMGQANVYLTESAGNTGLAQIDLVKDGVIRQFMLLGSGQVQLQPSYFSAVEVVPAGTYVFKMTGKFATVFAGTPQLNIFSFGLSYIILGT